MIMKVISNWPMLSDVTIELNGTPLILGEEPDFLKNKGLHGTVTQGDIDLSVDEAEEIGNALLEMSRKIRKLNKELEENLKNSNSRIEEDNSGGD